MTAQTHTHIFVLCRLVWVKDADYNCYIKKRSKRNISKEEKKNPKKKEKRKMLYIYWIRQGRLHVEHHHLKFL